MKCLPEGCFYLFSHLILPEPWRRDFPPLLQVGKSRLREVNGSWLACATYSKMLSPEPGFLATFLDCTNLLLDLSMALVDRFREEEIEAQRGYVPCPRSHRQYEADAAFPASPRIRLLEKMPFLLW